MIKETLCGTAIDYEYPPDGGKVPVIDAYDGCQLNCSYCFQWRDQGWNRDILVKTNLPAVLARELDTWDAAQTLYVGSRSDPYMALESRYRLTRQILQLLWTRGIPCVLSTKSNASAFFDDLDLFRAYGDKLTVCIGQANLAHLRHTRDPHLLPNIRTAVELARRGIRVWAFITPVLPGITDVRAMVEALPADIPVFVDRLRLEAGSAAEGRFFEHLQTYYPQLESRYRALVQAGTDPYYAELREMYREEPRVRFVFGES
jgi:DNA repair photolyase